MRSAAVPGILLAVLAGAVSGTVLLPLKYTGGWKFENTWLLYSLLAYLISPWVVAWATVPHLGTVYGAPGPQACLLTGVSGFGWGLAVSFGALPSLLWCVWKLTRDHTWRLYEKGRSGNNALLCAFMGLLWITGTVFYGAAAGMLGSLGPVIGWPVYMSGIILVSNFWGWITGEWRGVSGRPMTMMVAGIAVQIVSMVMLGQAQS